jgi:WD40 repeat protein
LATDASGRLLTTVSDDKTLRLWSLPDGTPRGVLRPPIGPAQDGRLYAIALSADDNRAFVASSTGHALRLLRCRDGADDPLPAGSRWGTG